MNLIIKQEAEQDYKVIEDVVRSAFEMAEYSDGKEHILVSKLRSSEAYIPELSLIAWADVKIVGHIMLTKIYIDNGYDKFEALALAPVSVIPQYQSKGIGSKLINRSLEIAKEMGYKSVIVLGHETYYPRFGFRPAHIWNIKAPFEVPKENFMALELVEGSLSNIEGVVVYAPEFFE